MNEQEFSEDFIIRVAAQESFDNIPEKDKQFVESVDYLMGFVNGAKWLKENLVNDNDELKTALKELLKSNRLGYSERRIILNALKRKQ